VTVTDARGCSFTSALPFERALATRPCRRLRVATAPGRLSPGRRTRLRLRVTAIVDGRRVAVGGARVGVGRRIVRTNGAGRASVVVRPRRAGVLRVVARARDYLSGSARVRVAPPRRRGGGVIIEG
jgi:hypothetical protein